MSTEKKKKRRVAKLKKKKKKRFGLNWKKFWAEAKTFWAEKSVFGLKNVWAEKKSILGWKIKGNTPKEKKKKAGRKEKKKRGGWPGNKKEKEVCGAERKRKMRAGQIIFQHLFSFESSQKKIMVNSFVLDLIFSMN